MTALKPLENRRVRGVKAGKYPLNEKCAHPECKEPTADGHHCFPRSEIGNSLWFVEIRVMSNGDDLVFVVPHVTGLCRAHHDDVEEHRAWIKLEDGEFVWYDRVGADDVVNGEELHMFEGVDGHWRRIGPLNPQPGSREGKPKRKRFQGEAKRKRRTISIKVPDDAAEDGAGVLDDLIDQLEERISGEDHRPKYYTLVDGLGWTLLNSSEEDFVA